MGFGDAERNFRIMMAMHGDINETLNEFIRSSNEKGKNSDANNSNKLVL